MRTLFLLIKRNTKIYFKDKGLFFSSLITPMILLILYSTFLKKVFTDSFRSALTTANLVLPENLIENVVNGEIVSSILAVSTVTVAFCSNMLIIRDKNNDALRDFTVSPVKPWILALGYYLASLLSDLIVCFIATGLCFVYLSITGWYLSALDVVLILVDVIALCMFGTILSSIVNFFLTSDSQSTAVSTIVSCGYGFISGAYMPLSSFSNGLRNTLMFLPGTYGTNIIKNHTMTSAFEKIQAEAHVPDEAIESFRDYFDCNLRFFDNSLGRVTPYLVFYLSIAVLILIYLLLNIMKTRRALKK